MNRIKTARACMALIGLYALSIGAIAAFAPHAFYADFPFLTHWVNLLPPYNEHLVTDVGGLYLGFAVVAGWAAWRPERTLVLATATGFLLVGVIHLVFHASHLRGFGTADAIGEIAGLALLLIPPSLAIWAVRSDGAPRTRT